MRAFHFVIMLMVGTLVGCSPKVMIDVGAAGSERNLVATAVLKDTNPGKDKVAIIDVRGMLADAHKPTLLGQGVNPVDSFVTRLELAERDPDVKAVILRITSPGGTVTASDIMYREVRRFEEVTHKPVIASLGEIAASGGYYLALSSDEIIAEPTSITGSIGVIMPTINVSEGLERIGIRSRSVKSGANKDIGNPLEPMREPQYAILQGMIDEYFARFKGLVIERRPGIKLEDIPMCTDGRVFSGANAKALGLVDDTGGVREAFAAAKQRAGIAGATLVKYADEDYPARTVYTSTDAAAPSSGVTLRLDTGFAETAETGGFFYLWMPGF